jgi:hypothetical protein
LLSAGELTAASGWRPARVRAALAALSAHNLIATEELAGAPECVHVATTRGLRLLAVGAGLAAATYARAVGALVETRRTRRGDTQRLRFLRRTPAHTRGVSAAYLAFVQAARAVGGTLEWWGEWASTLTDEDNESPLRLRPDAAGVLILPAGRLAFFLEVDRGTTVTARLGAKLALYERYRLTADAPPFTVLLVLQGKRRAQKILSADAARQERLWKPEELDVRYTTASALAAQGPLAPIWRNLAGDGTTLSLH